MFQLDGSTYPLRWCRGASRHRSVAATNLNRSSSRSHAVLTLEVIMTDSTAQKSESSALED